MDGLKLAPEDEALMDRLFGPRLDGVPEVMAETEAAYSTLSTEAGDLMPREAVTVLVQCVLSRGLDRRAPIGWALERQGAALVLSVRTMAAKSQARAA